MDGGTEGATVGAVNVDRRSVAVDRRAALRSGLAVAAYTVAGCLGGNGGTGGDGADGGGGEADGGEDDTESPVPTIAGSPGIASPAFDGGETIPTRFTCEGADVSPELDVADVPGGATSLALLVDDPDAPGGTFTHWLLWEVPASTDSIPEAVPTGETVSGLGGAKQGTNDADVLGYSGPCPPPGDGPHTYRFRLIALAGPLDLEAGAGRTDFDQAVGDVASSEAELRGTYER